MNLAVWQVSFQPSDIKQNVLERLGPHSFKSGLLWRCPVLKCRSPVLKVTHYLSDCLSIYEFLNVAQVPFGNHRAILLKFLS